MAPLLERESEFAALNDALADAAAGRGRLVVIEGPAGVGKSRLLDLVREQARAMGEHRLLRASGCEQEQEVPFGVTLQLWEPIVGQETDESRDLLRGAASASRELFEGRAWTRMATEPAAMATLTYALYRLTCNLAERSPLVLTVDDLCWSDSASVRHLLHLAHRLDELPLLLAVALRTGEPASTQPEVVALAGHERATVLRPKPLGPDAVATLVRERLPGADDDLCAACEEVSGGNPFLLRELLASIAGEGAEPTLAAVRSLTPETVSRSVLKRLSRFPPEALRLARGLAVLGGRTVPIIAAAVAGLEPAQVSAFADSLAEAGILANGGDLAFAHPLLTSAVLADAGPHERGRLHEHAARVLHERGADDAEVAAHLIATEPIGEAWAVEALCRGAAQCLAEGGPEAAARRYERALREPLEATARAETEAALGQAELAAGRPAGAGRVEHAMSALPARRQAELLLDLGNALQVQGRPDEAAAIFARGIAALEAAGLARGAASAGDAGGGSSGDASCADLAAELKASRALAALWDPEQGPGALAEAAPTLDPDHVPNGIGERVLLVGVASADLFASRHRERATELAWRAWGDGAWLDQAGPADARIGNLVGVLTFSDAYDRSLEVCERIVAEATRSGMPIAVATAVYLRGILQVQRGRLLEGIADLEQALEAEPLGWPFLGPTARGTLASARLLTGDIAAAKAALALTEEEERAALEDYLFGPHWAARGQLALAEGRPEDAFGHFTLAGRQLESIGNHNPGMFNWISGAAIAALRLGEGDRARELAERGLAAAEEYGAPRALALALRTRALIQPRVRDRLPRLKRAVEVLDGCDSLVARALVHVNLGAALRKAKGNSTAREPLLVALEAADQAGAETIAERAREELALAGSRPRRAQRAGVASLTAGELRVARLAARGLTNREISEALFISRKTVDFHLRGTYRKLGVNDRAALGPLLEAPPAPAP